MLSGTKSIEDLARFAPTMVDLDTEPVELSDVEILTVLYEFDAASMVDVLPPGLHPTIPPLLTWMIWQVGDSPFGSFAMAQLRVECRSGARPRAFLVSAVVDSPDAAAALGSHWGFTTQLGEITIRRSYDRKRVTAELGDTVLDLEAVDPVPLRPADVQWISNMHAAQTPRGLRLVQVDPTYDVVRAERARPVLHAFDAAAWGEPGIAPTSPVAASICSATITLPRLRFLCAPDQLAFMGTEVIDRT